ncbi:hypothetical protein Ddc_13369 [Ditylenchus destructor]|nr:hypothetical protein Ddc_13369 [Ditylenchus destructor]
MAANRSLEEQKKKLHSILLSRRDGYTNTAHILRDLRDDFGHDGIALAQAHGYHSFQTFLESASMREYCRCAEELRTTTVYYGIGTEQTEHIEREMQISLSAKLEKLNKDMRKLRRQLQAKNSEISKMSHTVEKMAERLKNAEKRPNGTVTSDSTGLNLRRQVGFLKRSDSETSDIPGDPHSVSANSTTESDAQTDCKDLVENVVETEDETPHEIFATLKFQTKQHGKGDFMDRFSRPWHSAVKTISLQYYGKMTAGRMTAEIYSQFPNDADIHNFKVQSIRYFDRSLNIPVDVPPGSQSQVVPKGHYTIELNLKGGMTRAQLEEKLQTSEAQLKQISDKHKELEEDLRTSKATSEGTISRLQNSYFNLLHYKGGKTRAQLEEKLQNSEAQLQQMSEENQQLKDDLCTLKATSEGTISRLQNSLDERNVELYNSEVSNRELMESNRNLDRLKVFLKEFAENAETSQDLLNTVSAELEAEQKRQSENVKNTSTSANTNSDSEMFDTYSGWEYENSEEVDSVEVDE